MVHGPSRIGADVGHGKLPLPRPKEPENMMDTPLFCQDLMQMCLIDENLASFESTGVSLSGYYSPEFLNGQAFPTLLDTSL